MGAFFSRDGKAVVPPQPFGLKLGDKEFRKIAKLVYERAGICLGDHKKELVRTRLQKRLRHLGMASYAHYYRYVTEVDESGQELVMLIDAISTNKTDFFREKQHFDFLANEALPALMEAKERAKSRRLRVWSAGCSTGAEPYTLAMVMRRAIPNLGAWDLKILATDISTRVLGQAISGQYTGEQAQGIPPTLASEFVETTRVDGEKVVTMRPELKSMITFRRLNLMDESYPFAGLFDIIFCRNVMIYFDKATQEVLVNKFYRYTEPGGYLYIGHSESLTGIRTPYRYLRPTMYRK